MCSHRKDRRPLSETHIANNAVSNSIPIKKKEMNPSQKKRKVRQKESRVFGPAAEINDDLQNHQPWDGKFLRQNKRPFQTQQWRACRCDRTRGDVEINQNEGWSLQRVSQWDVEPHAWEARLLTWRLQVRARVGAGRLSSELLQGFSYLF